MMEEFFSLDADGIALRGKIYAVENLPVSSPAVVILHGIPRSKPEPGDPGYAPMAREFAQAGFQSLFLNFRGAGDSGGNFSILGWTRDLNAAIDRLEQEYAPAGIALLGFSGGAAVAIHVAAHDPRVSAVVAASCPANFGALGVSIKVEDWLRNFKEIGLIRDPGFPASVPDWLKEFEEVAPEKWVDKLSPRPILFIHGEKDELVPLEHARLLFAKAGEPKEFFMVRDAPHRLRLSPVAIAKAKEWLLSWKQALPR